MIFIPVILDPFSFEENRFVWEYLKYMYHSFENHWPIIAQKKYAKAYYGSPEFESTHYFTDDFMTRHQFKALDVKEIEAVEKYYIDDEIIDNLIVDKGSRLEAKIFLLKYRYEPLEKALEKCIEQIRKNHKEIGGFLGWAAHFESVKAVARKYNIKFITQEYAIRHVNYRSCCYLCDGDIYDSKGFMKLFKEFEDEVQELNYCILDRKELLSLFMTERTAEVYKKYKLYDKSLYKIGFAGVHPFITTFLAKSMYTDLELALDLRKLYSEEDILFRMHPGDEPFQANYGFKNIDKSLTAAEFICKCEKIAAIGSNIIPESFLWGRPVYTNDISPFYLLCNHEMDGNNWYFPSDVELNYIFLVYFVPFELICSEEYLTWRMSKPRAIEIYIKHLNYYFEQDCIPQEVLLCRKVLRFKQIMIARGLAEYV